MDIVTKLENRGEYDKARDINDWDVAAEITRLRAALDAMTAERDAAQAMFSELPQEQFDAFAAAVDGHTAPLHPAEARSRCREVETLVEAVRKMQLHPIGVLSEVHEAMRPFTREEKRE